MRKSVTVSVAFISVLAAQGVLAASAMAGIVYERPGSASEYPPAFRTKVDVQISGTDLPGGRAKKSVACSLAKGAELIFARGETVTQTRRAGTYRAKQAISWELIDNNGSSQPIEITKGQTVEDLSYLAEGFCDVRIGKTIGQASCFGNGPDTNQWEVLSNLDQESYIKVTCKSGKKAWFGEQYLKGHPKFEAFFYNPY